MPTNNSPTGILFYSQLQKSKSGTMWQDTRTIRGLRRKFHLPVPQFFEMAVQEPQPKYLGNAVPKGRGNPVAPHIAERLPGF